MKKLDLSSWKEVKIIDLFEIKRGSGKVTKVGKYPLITASAFNNGVGGLTDTANFKNSLTVSANGAPGASFYHKEEFGATSDVIVLKEKIEISENSKLFLSVIMSKTFMPKYNYGKKLGNERLSKESIFLPFKEGQIDWLWMEEFMEKIKLKKEEIEASKPKYKKGKIDISSWKSFKLIDLFDFKIGSNNISKTGKFPQISASGINRGRTGLVDSAKFENCFTCAKDGQPGITFWHPYKFDINNHVTACIPKFKCSNNVGLFLEVIMTKSLIPKYNYGKALGINRIKNESIFLPEKDGQPDWEYMENFMNDLIVT